MAFRADPKILADAVEKAMGTTCDAVLLRQEEYTEPVYPHLWLGWSLDRVRGWALKPVYSEHFADDDYYGDPDEPDVVGYTWARRPLHELLKPTQRTARWVEAGPRMEATGRRTGPGKITLDPVDFGRGLPPGNYIGLRLYGSTGTEVGVFKFTGPLMITDPKDNLSTTHVGIEIS